jgi:hypothetical protein
MKRLDKLKKHLEPGKVYRRNDLVKWSKSVDRHLHVLVQEGTLQKLSQGVYYYPKESVFGKTPPEEHALVERFLKDSRFLLTSPNAYNALGVGTTQVYNKRTVYNHKRHGEFTLGNRIFDFQVKHHFPTTLTREFLFVDLVNNIDKLAEDRSLVLHNALSKMNTLDEPTLKEAVESYGNARAKKILEPLLYRKENPEHAH